LDDRKDLYGNLGNHAHQFLANCSKYGETILISRLVCLELGDISEETLNKIMVEMRIRLETVPIAQIQINEARSIAQKRNILPNDVLHALLARDNQAILITRDRHFGELADIVLDEKPENVIFPSPGA
jgi:predicted nucleic acid-binding protein